MRLRYRLWKLYKKARHLQSIPNDRNMQYWDAAARFFPLSAICTSANSEEDFRSKGSIINDPSITVTKEMTVLDVGCGVGRIVPFVVDRAGKYVGVDFSKGMIKKARKRNRQYRNVEFFVNDGWTFPFILDGSVDVAVCELCFQHISKQNTLAYIGEVHRVLKDGGVFIAQVPRLDYYGKEGNYALTKEETDCFYSVYRSVEYVPYEHEYAYYLVRATR